MKHAFLTAADFSKINFFKHFLQCESLSFHFLSMKNNDITYELEAIELTKKIIIIK